MYTRFIRILLCLVLTAAILAGCAGGGGTPVTDDAQNGATGDAQDGAADAAPQERPEVFSQDEYVLYQNIFYSGNGADYDGVSVEKEGVFAEIHDAYNDLLRYYVWGYYDQTRCCDWQWEFVPREGQELPAVGSLVTVKGVFSSGESALDGYWITDAQVETKTAYAGVSAALDMRSMGATLERVQMYNIISHPDVFEGQSYVAYGRIASLSSIQDPYYDSSWSNGILWDGDVPAIGTLVEVSGTVENGALRVASMNRME